MSSGSTPSSPWGVRRKGGKGEKEKEEEYSSEDEKKKKGGWMKRGSVKFGSFSKGNKSKENISKVVSVDSAASREAVDRDRIAQIDMLRKKMDDLLVPNRTASPYFLLLELLTNLSHAMCLEAKTICKVEDLVISSTESEKLKRVKFINPEQKKLMQQLIVLIEVFLKQQDIISSYILIQSAFRTYRARTAYTTLRRDVNVPYVSAVQELVCTERSYLRHLEVLVDVYMLPLQKLSSSDQHFREDTKGLSYKSIFSNMEEIRSIHKIIVGKLGELIEGTFPNISGVGDVILECAPRFKCYDEYVTNYKVSMNTLAAFVQNKLFVDFMNEQLQVHIKEYSDVPIQVANDATENLRKMLALPLTHLTNYERKVQTMINCATIKDDLLMPSLLMLEETNKFIGTTLAEADNHAELVRLRKRYVAAGAKKVLILLKKRRTFLNEWTVELSANEKKKFPGTVLLFHNLIIASNNNDLTETWAFNLASSAIAEVKSIPSTFMIECNDPIPKSAIESDNIGEIKDSPLNFHFENPQTMQGVFKVCLDTLSGCVRNKVFGVALTDLMHRNTKERTLPFVLCNLCEYILKNAVDAVGLFRIPGNATVIAKIKQEMNQNGGYTNLEEAGIKINDAAGLLKLYLRELPDPICTNKLFIDFFETQMMYNHKTELDKMVAAIADIVKKMPEDHLMVLKYIISFLRNISKYEATNMMSPNNLSMCMGPNILRPEEETMEYTLNIAKANGVILQMIVYFDTIFSDKPSTAEPETVFGAPIHNVNPSNNNDERSLVSALPIPSPVETKSPSVQSATVEKNSAAGPATPSPSTTSSAVGKLADTKPEPSKASNAESRKIKVKNISGSFGNNTKAEAPKEAAESTKIKLKNPSGSFGNDTKPEAPKEAKPEPKEELILKPKEEPTPVPKLEPNVEHNFSQLEEPPRDLDSAEEDDLIEMLAKELELEDRRNSTAANLPVATTSGASENNTATLKEPSPPPQPAPVSVVNKTAITNPIPETSKEPARPESAPSKSTPGAETKKTNTISSLAISVMSNSAVADENKPKITIIRRNQATEAVVISEDAKDAAPSTAISTSTSTTPSSSPSPSSPDHNVANLKARLASIQSRTGAPVQEKPKGQAEVDALRAKLNSLKCNPEDSSKSASPSEKPTIEEDKKEEATENAGPTPKAIKPATINRGDSVYKEDLDDLLLELGLKH